MKPVTTLLAAITLAAISLAATSLPAMAEDSPFAHMHGEWKGEASGIGPDRQPFTVTQTERVGPMLGGDITVIEGRGYEADGSVAFNAFGVLSYNPGTEGYELRAYRDGQSGTYPVTLQENGFIWTIPAGPAGEVRYTTIIEADSWQETGEFVPAGGEPVQIFEMSLTRTGETNWPAEGAVAP